MTDLRSHHTLRRMRNLAQQRGRAYARTLEHAG
jgi:hypothetical protein